MAIDLALVERLQAVLATHTDVTERNLFGGHAFMVGGHLVASASGDGSLLVRVEPDERETVIASTVATEAVMGERTMQGWVRVDVGAIAADEALAGWVRRGVERARALPPKS